VIIDYFETEHDDEDLLVRVGLQFEDEPGALYMALLTCQGTSTSDMKLYYNGFDCKYAFKQEEKQLIKQYLMDQGLVIDL
jgi:hypothetical protein